MPGYDPCGPVGIWVLNERHCRGSSAGVNLGHKASTAVQTILSLGMFQIAARQLVPYAPKFDQTLFQTILSGMGGENER